MSKLMNGSDKEHQVLTRIKGIGPVKQRWLKDSLKISTIRDLATCSVEQIESRLKAQGQTFSRSEIKSWIEQAQKLIDSEPSAQEILELPQLTSDSKLLQLLKKSRRLKTIINGVHLLHLRSISSLVNLMKKSKIEP